MSEPALEASALTFSYPRTFSDSTDWRQMLTSSFALHNLNARVPRGSIYGLLGPNGSGKSTLLRLALGLLPTRRGSLRVLGLDPAADAVAIRRRIGYVPQKPDLDPEMTVGDALDFASMFFDAWSREIMDQTLERFDLSARYQDRIKYLSTGFQQRLALVMALAIEPEVLILDEPTAGLDAVVRRNFADAVIEFMASGEDKTVIIASHLLSEIEALVDHVGILRNLGHGSSDMLIEAPLEELKQRVLIVRTASGAGLDDFQGAARLLGTSGAEPATAVFWLEEGARRQRVVEDLRARGVTDLRIGESSLDEIFVTLARLPSVLAPDALAAAEKQEASGA